ncbi:hypothetical protein [Nocardioides abyssi]|uniref:WD40 repeat domain-containing protein n=1 Tax=Nocardioides abyssi TaxID=3058370 RepID=A0ABT8EY65_9ACTN|nr:hypothetical protein [Nocardioides abyssi]MDN4163073.1 hypothetical protein [Nocardioides abyssi]
MTTLHDRLADLAADADAHADVREPVHVLWDRGRRYHRLRRGGTAAIVVAALAVVGGVVGTAELRADTTPAPAGSPVGVPERIFAPSPYLEGTEDGGSLGRLAVLLSTTRSGMWGSEQGYVGVSAATGEYRFLDLPDAAPDPGAVLSPDGSVVAYWTSGPTQDTPNTIDGEPPVTGVALYHPDTGDVVRHDIATEHGLGIETDLDWVATDTLLVRFTQYAGGEGDSEMDRSTSGAAPTLLWDVDEPDPRPAESREVRRGFWTEPSGHAGQVVTVHGERTFSVVALDAPRLPRRYRTDQVLSTSVSAGPGGQWAAAVWGGPGDRGRNPNVLVGAPFSSASTLGGEAAARIDLPQVPGSRRYAEVVGWLDGSTVLARARRGGYDGRTVLDAVDLRDGATGELVVGPPEGTGARWQVATDLLREPTVDAVEPPRPMSPRLTAGLTGLTVLGAAGALVLWRRRVRP